MKQILLLATSTVTTVVLSILALTTQAQNNVGIGTTAPNSKAILELKATNKGFIAPRMTTAQMLAIAPTATESALLVYNTDSACYHFYNGTTWKNLCQQALDTALINKAIKNYLSSNSTTIINILKGDTALFNYTTINNAIINVLTVDTSITNVAIINNGNINLLKVDTSITNVANIGTSNTNYANINNLAVDSTKANFIQTNTINSSTFNGGFSNMDSLYIGGQNITKTITDSIAAQAWLLKGNNAPLANKLGTLNARDLHIVANNQEKITIVNTTGYVGINQAVPSQHLDVAGNLKFDLALMPNGIAGTNGNILVSKGALLAPQWQNGSTLAGTLNNVSWSLLGNSGTNPNTNFLGTTDNKSLRFRTNNTQKMIVDSMGNVGIGTSTPNRLLHLKSNYSLVMEGTISSWLLGSSNTGDDFNIWDDGLGAGIANVFRIDNARNIITSLNGGSVGIGTASPTSKLHVENGTFTQRQTTDVSHSLLQFNTASNRGWQTYHLASTDGTPNGYMLEYFDGSTWNRRMTIDQNGNMGIGVSVPTAKLQVDGGNSSSLGIFYSNNTSLSYVDIYNDNVSSGLVGSNLRLISKNVAGTGYGLVDMVKYKNGLFAIMNSETDPAASIGFGINNVQIQTITSAGNVGIGTANPTEKLEINGSVKITDGTQGAGKVLTSDATGKATWKTPVSSTVVTAVIPAPATLATVAGNNDFYSGISLALAEGVWEIEYQDWGQISTVPTSGFFIRN